MNTDAEKSCWKDYFHLTRTERRGTLMLSLIFACLTLWPSLRPDPGSAPPLPDDRLPADSFITETAPAPSKPFPFDPNTISYDSLVLLGIPARIARTLDNYREKGGRFRDTSDLMKLYGWRPEDQQRLKNWMRFPEVRKDRKKTYSENHTFRHKQRDSPIIDVNAADESQWQQLRGIGPYYAARILRFRNALGGFHQINQIADTWQLPDSTFQAIRPFLTLKTDVIQININTVAQKALANHPYISRRQAAAVIAFRQEHGPFADSAALSQVYALSDSTLERILPYLQFEIPDTLSSDSSLVD